MRYDVTRSDMAVKPEVNKNTLYLSQKSCFFWHFNEKISKMTLVTCGTCATSWWRHALQFNIKIRYGVCLLAEWIVNQEGGHGMQWLKPVMDHNFTTNELISMKTSEKQNHVFWLHWGCHTQEANWMIKSLPWQRIRRWFSVQWVTTRTNRMEMT